MYACQLGSQSPWAEAPEAGHHAFEKHEVAQHAGAPVPCSSTQRAPWPCAPQSKIIATASKQSLGKGTPHARARMEPWEASWRRPKPSREALELPSSPSSSPALGAGSEIASYCRKPWSRAELAAKLCLPSPPAAARPGPGLCAAGPGQASAPKAERRAAWG